MKRSTIKLDKEDLGQRLKEIRNAFSLNQKDFAQQLGVGNSVLCEFERGNKKPGIDFLILLHEKFNVNIYYVLFGKGSMFLDDGHLSLIVDHEFSIRKKDALEYLHRFRFSRILQHHAIGFYYSKLAADEAEILREVEAATKDAG